MISGGENFGLVAKEIDDIANASIAASEVVGEIRREGIGLAEIGEFGQR